MRPAKFLFALIIGAVFLITLVKVLFFALIAASVVGGIWLLTRLFASRYYGAYGPPAGHWQPQPFAPQHSPYAQPLDPNWQRGFAPATPLGKRIEVL
jgi:hypothetical protein